MRQLSALALLLHLAAASVSAQSPRVTPDGDPSVNPDSIYKLAIDPSELPEEFSRFLLDDGIVRLEKDGTTSRTYRQIVQILRPEGVENYQEMRFSYAPKHERFTLNWVRVVKPDGTVISDKPTQIQESDVPAQMGDPIYADRKVIRASITGVAPGTIVDYSYTTEDFDPFLEGDASFGWSVSTGLSVARSRYIVDAPADVKLNIREDNLTFKRDEKVVGGRRVMTWAIGDLPKIKRETFASDSNDIFMSVGVSLPITWSDIGAWYAGNAQSRYEMTDDVKSKLNELLVGARTLDDSLKAIHRWVAQDIRYVSIALGLGGYQPRPPSEVISSGFGDCKDKATIFITMLNHIGIEAHAVLLSSTGGVERSMPSIGQFDHAIAAFRRPGSSQYEYTDLTAKMTPLGEIPFGYQNEFGIVVHKNGQVEEITFPYTKPTDNVATIRVIGTLSPEGIFNGTFEETSVGMRQYGLRNAFYDPPDSTQKARMASGVVERWFPGAVGEYSFQPDGKNLYETQRAVISVTNGRAAQLSGRTAIVNNPLGSMAGFEAVARELETELPRKFPVDAMQVLGYVETVIEYRVTLPEGWEAEIPDGVEATSLFGSYRTTYAQEGRDLILTRRLSGLDGIHPPSSIDQLIGWLRAVARDDVGVILVRTSSGSSGG